MPQIGASNYPVAFGDLGFFVTRVVQQSVALKILYERYITAGLLGYFCWARVNGALLGVISSGSPVVTDSPVKLLQNAAS
jgi:HK97 family phage major capsid protein